MKKFKILLTTACLLLAGFLFASSEICRPEATTTFSSDGQYTFTIPASVDAKAKNGKISTEMYIFGEVEDGISLSVNISSKNGFNLVGSSSKEKIGYSLDRTSFDLSADSGSKTVSEKITLTGNASSENIADTFQDSLVYTVSNVKSLKSFTLEDGISFNKAIPHTTTKIVFTDAVAPSTASLTDLSDVKDKSVVGWLDGTTWYVSTQIKNTPVHFNSDSKCMFESTTWEFTYDTAKYNFSFEEIILSNIDTSNVTNMDKMFYFCSIKNLDLSKFDMSKVKSTLSMYSGMDKLEKITLGEKCFFIGSFGYLPTQYAFNIPDADGKWHDSATGQEYKPENVPSGVAATYLAYPKRQPYTLVNGKSFNSAIPASAETVSFIDTDSPSGISVTDLSSANDNSVVGWLDGTTWYVSTRKEGQKVIFNKDSSAMFQKNSSYDSATNTLTFSPAVKNINFGNVDTSNVTDMSYMFSFCVNVADLDLSNFDTSKVTTMHFMFYSTKDLVSLNISSFNTSSVTDMYGMFMGCEKLQSLDLTNFDTSKVTNMSFMLCNMSSLESLNISNFNTSKVTKMQSMFSNASKLKSLNVMSFDTSNVTTMDSMFYNLKLLETLDLSNFNTSKVTNMNEMFMYNECINSIYVSDKWTVVNATDSTNMFSYCTKIIGQSGTKYDSSKTDKSMANYQTGYLKYKASANDEEESENPFAPQNDEVPDGDDPILTDGESAPGDEKQDSAEGQQEKTDSQNTQIIYG